MAFLYLALAIIMEICATMALKASEGFTRLWPSLTAIGGYSVAFYALAICLRTIPVGVAYAIWSGLGIVLITLAAWLLYEQRLDGPALLGLAMIVAGVLVIQLFSDSRVQG
jgi:small multidrug resistance pump